MNGIDVSHHQGNINWKKVKEGGISFAMVKASQGSKLSEAGSRPFIDEKFYANIKSAAENGIFCGAYHFLTGVTLSEVAAEAEFFTGAASAVRELLTFPCAVDIEDNRYTKLTKKENTALIRRFCGRVREGMLTPMLYTNLNFSRNYLDMKPLCDIDVWFARYYAVRSPLPKPVLAGSNITIFQWNDIGRADGVEGGVDQNVCYFDYSKDQKITETPAIQAGDKVKFLPAAEYYYPGGSKIPAFAKKSVFAVAQTQSKNRDVLKGGKKCVLLSGIESWADMDLLCRAED